MQFLIGAYSIGYLIFWLYHDWAAAFIMFCYSCFLAVLPFTKTWIPTAIALIIAGKCIFFPYDSVYDADFIIVAVVFVPFTYISIADTIINTFRSLFRD